MIPDSELRRLADEFLGVFRCGEFKRTSTVPIQSLSVTEAYRVQDLYVESRIAGGEEVAGYKVGCTSRGIREQLGLTEAVCGRLMRPHVNFGNTTLDYRRFTNCAVEPEFVLWIGKELNGERLDDEFLRSAVDGVSAGIEVHNFRYWHGGLTTQELVASNCIHACLVVDEQMRPLGDLDLGMQGVELFVNGKLQASGIGYEVMDGPLRSLRWLVERLRDRGEALQPGQLVIPGSPVPLVYVPPNACVRASITSFGSVSAHFVAPA
jgi:2-keto-4-pentenoate hydratase